MTPSQPDLEVSAASSSTGINRHENSNPLLDQALRKHLESLQPEDRAAFEHCTAEEVIAAAERLSSTHAAQSRTRRYLARFVDIVKPLESYFDLVGNVAGSLPAGAQLGGIVWGALRFVIKAINVLSDHFERIVGVLEEVTQSLPFYQDYAVEIYRGSARVQQALADVYNDILLVCSSVRRVFLKKGGVPRSGPSIILQGLNPWNKTIEHVTQGLRRRKELLEHEVVHADRVFDHADRVSRHRQAMEREWDDRRRDFLAMLPYEDCHAKHEDCLSALSPDYNAGSWLLNRKEFLDWAYSPPDGLLWVHGKPGVGKTVLASIIIKWTRNALVSGKRPAVAFFYCEHDNPKKQDPRSILATLLYQVLRQLPAGPWDDLELDAFATTQSVQKLCISLKAACIHLERIKPVFLIVDALDECDTITRKWLLPLLVSLGHASRLLLTSRKQGDIEKALQNTPSIAITAKDVEDDINEYISRKVRLVDNEDLSDEPLEVGDPALLEEVSKTLIEDADGMFLWLQLQISHLQEQRTDHDIRKALRSLTKGLQPTFTRILKSIDRLPVSRRFRVQRLLRWVVCAIRPLSLRELSEAVVIHDMQGTWDDSRCVNRPITLIEDCFNLVLCTESFSQSPSNAKVQFIHASVKEFLLQNPVLLGSLADYHIYPFPDAQVTIVEDSLKYLQLIAENARREEKLRWDDVVWTQNGYLEYKFYYSEDLHPFVNYASEFWPQHLRASGPAGEQLVSVFCEFMQSTSRSRQFWSFCYNRKRDDVIHATMSVCHLAARLSLPHIVKSILANGLDTADIQGSSGLTALHLAAKFAEESTLIVLVESGANINARTMEGQTPLHLAAGNWDGECVVQALLNLKADVTVIDDDGMTPLHIAAQNGYGQRSVLLLLQHGANIGRFSKGGLLPLHAAAANPYGCTSVQHLLSYGADVNALNSHLRTPLHLAAGVWHRSIDSVRLLVERGANVNSTDRDGFTPLHMAAQSEGGSESVKFLIQHGANVDVTSVNGTTPLHLAAKARLGREAVKYLLENGADVEATDRLMQTPLHLAMTVQQDSEVVQVLLAYQANVHALDDEGFTPLQRVAQMGSGDKIASLLLEHGANVHCTDSKKCTPLHLAAGQEGRDDSRLVRVLLQYGAEVDARDDSGRTPLHYAVEGGKDGIMKVLLKHGADANAVTSLGETALHLAAVTNYYYWRFTVTLLLQHGANPYAVDAKGRTMFDCSSQSQGESKGEELRKLVASQLLMTSTDSVSASEL